MMTRSKNVLLTVKAWNARQSRPCQVCFKSTVHSFRAPVRVARSTSLKAISRVGHSSKTPSSPSLSARSSSLQQAAHACSSRPLAQDMCSRRRECKHRMPIQHDSRDNEYQAPSLKIYQKRCTHLHVPAGIVEAMKKRWSRQCTYMYTTRGPPCLEHRPTSSLLPDSDMKRRVCQAMSHRGRRIYAASG